MSHDTGVLNLIRNGRLANAAKGEKEGGREREKKRRGR